MKRINPSNVKFVNTLVQTRIILLWKFHQFMKNNRNRSNMILVTFSNTTSITFSRKSYLKRLLDQFMRGRNHLKINVKFVNSFVFKIVTLNIMLCQFMRRSNYSNVIHICDHISSQNNNMKKHTNWVHEGKKSSKCHICDIVCFLMRNPEDPVPRGRGHFFTPKFPEEYISAFPDSPRSPKKRVLSHSTSFLQKNDTKMRSSQKFIQTWNHKFIQFIFKSIRILYLWLQFWIHEFTNLRI